MNEGVLTQAAQWLRDADGILITAGAGMGVDSGLPDFRGEDGFWKAYPALRHGRISFEAMASAEAMKHDPERCWGFYGHRLALYRRTEPHEGFQILRRWAAGKPYGAFVFTSNVDGQFQKAGFDENLIVECHGSIHWLQCQANCRGDIWAADDFFPAVDEASCRLIGQIPACPSCGALARPNVLMFGDWKWVDDRLQRQYRALERWRERVTHPVVVELGAGKTIPTIRHYSERYRPRVIRINLREESINPRYGVGIAGGALDTLRMLDELV